MKNSSYRKLHTGRILPGILIFLLVISAVGSDIATYGATSLSFNPNPPNHPVRLIFIHHSTGENWLSDENGGLGIALRDNNYYVSDTNYGWEPDNIGDRTDIGNWWEWFRGPNSSTYLNALYNEGEQHCSYSRLSSAPSGENEIIMFKSCFPNSALQGDPNDLVPSINNNPLRGEGSGSEYHTVANAKGIYIDLLEYFRTRQDKLFIVITAPPLSDPEYAANARAFNNWLVNDWLTNYPHNNVFVFDFYNVLTTNGGNANTNDLGQETGNHHRWWNNIIQHKTDGDNDSNPNILEYPSSLGNDHPTQAGNLKATGEFLPLLNVAYHRWKLLDEIMGTGGTWSSGIYYYNLATTTWSKPYGSTPTGPIAVGDITGDGKADMVSCWPTGLWYQNGATLGWTMVYSVAPSQIAVRDISGDGRTEIIGSWSSGIWYWNPATSGWTQMYSSVPSGPIAAGDITGDGRADVVSVWPSGLWYQNGATLGWTKVFGTAPSKVAAGDITGDSRAEIIGTWSTGIWYWNPATSGWTQMYSSVPSGPIAAGDVTGDGRADVVSVWPSGLWYQNGATLGWTQVYSVAPSKIAVGDITGD